MNKYQKAFDELIEEYNDLIQQVSNLSSYYEWYGTQEKINIIQELLDTTTPTKSQKTKTTSKSDQHLEIVHQLNETYRNKNQDYGDAFGLSIQEYGLIAGLVRMEDKFNRLKHLLKSDERLVKDETLEDTLLDLANYAIMLVIEMRNNHERD